MEKVDEVSYGTATEELHNARAQVGMDDVNVHCLAVFNITRCPTRLTVQVKPKLTKHARVGYSGKAGIKSDDHQLSVMFVIDPCGARHTSRSTSRLPRGGKVAFYGSSRT